MPFAEPAYEFLSDPFLGRQPPSYMGFPVSQKHHTNILRVATGSRPPSSTEGSQLLEQLEVSPAQRYLLVQSQQFYSVCSGTIPRLKFIEVQFTCYKIYFS